jgi:hypothetical protein
VLYHLFASYVASYVAARLGRSLFQSDRPELLQSVDEYYASLQHDPALGEPVAFIPLTQERPLYRPVVPGVAARRRLIGSSFAPLSTPNFPAPSPKSINSTQEFVSHIQQNVCQNVSKCKKRRQTRI